MQLNRELSASALRNVATASVRLGGTFALLEQSETRHRTLLLEAERTAHDEKTLGHGGRIKELEQELEGLRSTLGAQVDQLTAENDELRQRMEEEREEIGALNQQLVKFSTYIEQLEGTRDEQLEREIVALMVAGGSHWTRPSAW